jgi:O-antigen ligase
MLEMEEAWLPWWGGEDPTHPITGTFYWWNPFAAYVLAGTTVGFAVFLRGRAGLAAFGLAGFVLGAVGLVYATSRAADACAVVALVVVTGAHLWSARWRGLRRVGPGLAAAAATVWVVGGPPFFPHRSAPLAATAAREAAHSLTENGSYRTEFWREALKLFGRHPVVGGGYHSLATESVGHVPHTWALSPLAHNGYLQALSDGGLLLGVPFLLGCGAITLFVLFALRDAVRNRDFSVGSFAVPLVLGALLAHSAVDFDWSYPADLLLTAVLAGIVAGNRWARRVERSDRQDWRMGVAVLAGVGLLVVAAVVAHAGDLHLNLPVTSAHGVTP